MNDVEVPVGGTGPVSDRARIDSLDILRGFALMGILVVNIQSFSMPSTAYLIPNSYGSLEGLHGFLWLVGYLLFDLKFMAMFSMLFGAGIVLMSQHRDIAEKPVLGVHFRRMFLLLVFGLVHAYLIWYGDILVPYAICGCFVVWVRKWSSKRLFIVGAIVVVFGCVSHILIGLSAQYFPDAVESIRDDFMLSMEDHQVEIDAYRGAWSEHFLIRFFEVLSMHFFVFPLMFFLRLCGLMCLGIALFKSGVLDASRSTAFYVRMAMMGAAIGIPLVGLGAFMNEQHDFDPAFVLGYGALANYFGSVFVALMWVALVMLVCRSKRFSKVHHVLSSYGRMAFTNYIGQTVIATWIFYGYGLGWFGSVSRVEQLGVVLVIWTVQLTLSPLWLRYFRFGPLEWVWRTGTYMKFQPIRR